MDRDTLSAFETLTNSLACDRGPVLMVADSGGTFMNWSVSVESFTPMCVGSGLRIPRQSRGVLES
jgi:hypothetical protein